MFTIAIVGSRTFNDYDKFKDYLNKLITDKKPKITEYRIVSGGAVGVDTMAKQFAKENNKEIIEFLPDWRKNGRIAGFMRNSDIISCADWVIAFSQNNSNGTNDSIKKAQKMKKLLDIIYV